jgi:hypothetical protein
VNSGRVLFTIVGVTYFLSSEIGLTMGICNILLLVFLCQFYLATGKPFGGEALELTQAGSYIGYAVVLIYAGRTYYWSVLKKAFLFIGDDNEHERDSVLAARVLLVSFAAFVSVLYWMGLEPVVGVIYGLFVLLMFLVFTRIVCETGIPFLQTVWQPSFLLPKILGLSAIGVGPISFIYWMGSILHQDTRECMMPYVATSLKVADDNNVGLRRILVLGLAAVVLAFAVGFIAQARNIYNYGAAEDSYSYDTVAIAPFDRVARDVETMTNYNLIEDSNEASGLGKLKLVKFDGSVISLVLLGAGAVIVFSIMRFRFTWFPLHPVLFLVWNTYPLNGCMYSFLIGWAIKEIIVRFGGGKVYQQLKPLFIGLIVGEVIAACSGIIVGLIYFAVTDQMPKRFGILPG